MCRSNRALPYFVFCKEILVLCIFLFIVCLSYRLKENDDIGSVQFEVTPKSQFYGDISSLAMPVCCNSSLPQYQKSITEVVRVIMCCLGGVGR